MNKILYILKKYKYTILKNRLGENVEKPQLVNFIAKVLEDSGFKVYKNFKTSQQVIDIYAILPTSMGDFGMVIACKNYDKEWEVGIDVLKEMEVIAKKLKASKVGVITSSKFSAQAKRYGEERKIKLVDRNQLVTLAKKYNTQKQKEPARLSRNENIAEIDSESFYNRDVSRDYIDNINDPYYSRGNDPYSSRNDSYSSGNDSYSSSGLQKVYNPYDSLEEYEEDIEYYEEQVGGIDLSGYSEYDDELYRAEFLNKIPDDNTYQNSASSLFKAFPEQEQSPKGRNLTGNKSKPKKENRNYNESLRSFNTPNTQSNKRSQRKSSRSLVDSESRFHSSGGNALSNYNESPQKAGLLENLKPLLGNTVVSIIVVVIIAYLIAFILGSVVHIPTGFIGLTELFVALILSYGLVLYTDRGSDILVKGTIVFFASLIILITILIAF